MPQWQIHGNDPRHRNVPPDVQALSDMLNRLSGRLSGADAEPGPMPQSPYRMQRTQDIELDPMTDGPGIMPLRPRRDLPQSLPVTANGQSSFNTNTGGVPGDGMPPDPTADPESDMAMLGLREAQGNLAPMLNRYGLGGYGNIDRSGGKTTATIHGDPVQAEASRVRMLRDRARQAGDLNRTMAQSRAQMIAGGNDYPRMDPREGARFERESIAAADMASPDIPPDESQLPTGVDELAAIRALLTRGRAANVVGREGAVSSARSFMDPTVTAARGMARDEAAETQERDIMGRVRAQLAGNPDAAFMPELRRLLGLDTGEEAEVGAGTMDVMTQDELLEFAGEQNMSPEEARAYVMQHGITVQ